MEENKEYLEEELTIHKKGLKQVTYYTDSIMWVIQESILNAEKFIIANMAYLTNDEIIESLIELALKNIRIALIIGNNETNNKNFHLYNKLLEAGIKIYQNGDDDWRKGIMHRKSVIIDGEILLCGSYNWTNHAERNQEELIVIEDLDTIRDVHNSFISLQKTSNELHYKNSNIGNYQKCTKNRIIEIESWWNQIDNNWKTIFRSTFHLKSKPNETDLVQLSNCEYLVVNFEKELDNIEPLSIFNNLKHLIIYNCPKITDLTPLSKLTNLKHLDIAKTNVEDLTPLTKLNNLEELNISNTRVSDLDPICHVPLKKIIIYNLDLFGFFEPKPSFFMKNPDCEVEIS
jgi:hypothetical protein